MKLHESTKDLQKLGFTKKKAIEMLERLKTISKDDDTALFQLVKCYKEVLRLGYFSKEEYTQFVVLGLNIPVAISELMGAPVSAIIQDIEDHKLDHNHVEFAIRSVTSEKK